MQAICKRKLIKKIGLAALLCSFGIVQMAFSQLENVRLGFQLTPSFNWMTTDDAKISRIGTNLGLTIGPVAEYYLSERFALTSGVALSFNRGGTVRHEIGGNFLPGSELTDSQLNTGTRPLPDGTRIKYKLQYLELPVSLKYRTAEQGYIRYFVEAPMLQWGVRFQARGDIQAGEITAVNENIARDVAIVNVAWGFGAGMEYAIGAHTSLVGGLYFSRSLTDVTNDNANKAILDPNNDPFNLDDDYSVVSENSKGLLNAISLRIAILF